MTILDPTYHVRQFLPFIVCFFGVIFGPSYLPIGRQLWIHLIFKVIFFRKEKSWQNISFSQNVSIFQCAWKWKFFVTNILERPDVICFNNRIKHWFNLNFQIFHTYLNNLWVMCIYIKNATYKCSIPLCLYFRHRI